MGGSPAGVRHALVRKHRDPGTLGGGSVTNNAAIAFDRSDAITLSNVISGTGSLTQAGAGTLTLSGAASSYTGDTTLSAGTLVLNNANALGTASVFSMAAGTTLTLNQRTYVGDVDQLGGTINGTGELVSTLFRTESGTLAAVIADDDAVARGIRKLGSGTTTVTAANTFTGTVRVDAGTLALGSGGSFAAGASALVEGGTSFASGGDLRVRGELDGSQ